MKNRQALQEQYGKKAIAQVIRILSDHALIIDAGKEDGLEEHTEVQVYEPAGVLSALNGSELDSLEYVKASLYVTRAENGYSICQTDTYRESISAALSPLLAGGREHHYSFRVDENEVEPLVAKDPVIRIGDPVKLA